MTGKIVVIGSSNVDLIMKMARLPQRGETITDAVFLQTFGGKGANQAVAAARAGGDVTFVNCVGDDPYGAAILDNLRAAQVDTRFVFTERDMASGTALVMIGDAGDNYLSVAPGANYRLSRQHIDLVRAEIDRAELLVLQYEIPPDTLQYVLGVAAAAQRPVLFNLAPARPLAEEALRCVSYLIVNESEAEFLSGQPVASWEQAQTAALTIRDRGPAVVIITLGVQGACVLSGPTAIHVPAFPVTAVDTTAAGDVFCGSLAAALVEGQSLTDGVRWASAAAAIAVTRLGAQPSIPWRAEIDRFLSER
jgi:ribokinase